jgi:hypothetical protein
MAQADLILSAVVAANGEATLSVRPYGRATWIIQQVGIEATGIGSGALGMIRKNGSPITPFVAAGDAPAGEPYVTLRGNDTLTIEWTGATVGAGVKATVLYDDGQPE